MKIYTISSSVLLHLIVCVSANANRKCCPVDLAVVRKNATLLCGPDADRRIQTNVHQNDFISHAISGSCIELFENNTAIFEVDSNGEMKKKETVQTRFYPKCCPTGRSYDPKLHSCQPSNPTNALEASIPANSFIKIGLPRCEVIQDNFFTNLSEVDVSGGVLRLKKDDRRVDEGRFCVDSTVSGSVVVRVCESFDLCESVRCIRKCCQDGQSFVNGSKCMDTFEYGVDLRVSEKIEEPDAPFAIIHGMPRPIYILKRDIRIFNIDKSGTFGGYFNITESYNYYPSSEHSYCIEHAYKKGRINAYAIFFKALKAQMPMKFVITRWIKILSCIFLFLTMVVYLMLPKMLNLFGKILLNYCLATFLFFFFLSLSQFLFVEYNDGVCKFIGFLNVMASLWSFTWLHIMCIDIWVSFGTPRTFSGPLQRNEMKKLIQYSIYGWGFPLIWILTVILLNVYSILPEALHPYVGNKKCYMEKTGDHPGNYAYSFFLTLPVLLQQIANIVLFVKTLIYCLKIRGEIQRMNESSKKNYKVGREELNLVMKLAVIMGVSFLFETVSSMYDFSKTPVTEKIEVVWDTINCLQGFFIFLVFVCKRKVLDSLLEKFNLKKRCKYDVSSSLATQESLHSTSVKRTTMSLR